MRVGTFHRLALDLLRKYAPERMGAIADRGEACAVLQEAIADIDTEISVNDALSPDFAVQSCRTGNIRHHRH